MTACRYTGLNGGRDRREAPRLLDAGTIARVFVAVAMLALAASSRAQECSGGPDGGADAAGPQCNSPGRAFLDTTVVEIAPSGAASDPTDAVVLRKRGLEEYERGQYEAAVRLFRRAAQRGDVRSAELMVLMHRYNARLYGGRVAISVAEARVWAGVVARAAQSTLTAGTQPRR